MTRFCCAGETDESLARRLQQQYDAEAALYLLENPGAGARPRPPQPLPTDSGRPHSAGPGPAVPSGPHGVPPTSSLTGALPSPLPPSSPPRPSSQPLPLKYPEGALLCALQLTSELVCLLIRHCSFILSHVFCGCFDYRSSFLHTQALGALQLTSVLVCMWAS